MKKKQSKNIEKTFLQIMICIFGISMKNCINDVNFIKIGHGVWNAKDPIELAIIDLSARRFIDRAKRPVSHEHTPSESIPVPPPPLLPRHPSPIPPFSRSSFRTDEMIPIRTASNSGAVWNVGNTRLGTNFGPELYSLGHQKRHTLIRPQWLL